MITKEELEESLPFPVKIVICCVPRDFRMAVNDSFQEMLDRHNENYESKIDHVFRFYVDTDDNELELEYNEFEIYIGKDLVYKGKGPALFDTTPYEDECFYNSIVTIMEGILNASHDRIIKVQEENYRKIEQFEDEEYYEMLYAYYNFRINSKAFFYLKKLATRYPNSEYMTKLRRVYRRGRPGWHRRNFAMLEKTGLHRSDVGYF